MKEILLDILFFSEVFLVFVLIIVCADYYLGTGDIGILHMELKTELHLSTKPN